MKVKRASSGLFYRNIGYLLPDYWRQFPGRMEWVRMSGTTVPRTVRLHPERATQPKLYLGRDERMAVVAAGRLEQLWEQVEAQWKKLPTMQWYDPDARSLYTVELDRPYWDEVTLQIAEAVRTHQPVARLAVPSYLAGYFHRPSDVTDWLADLRERFPVVALELADASLASEGKADTEQRARRHQRRAKALLRTTSPQRLDAAIDAYRRWVESHYVGLDGKPSPTGGTKVRLIDFIREHATDIPLIDLDMHQIDAILDSIRRRPVSKKTSRPIAVKSAKNLIKEVRQFVRWLHRSPEWDWTKPLDYEVMPVRVITTPDERAGRVHQVKTYTTGELKLLWQYANPTERLMIAIGLNCGFGRAEVATLELGEVRLHAPNPVLRDDERQPVSEGDESWVMRGRHKTGVFGIWRLWPVTVRAVEWWLTVRPKTAAPNLLVTRKGESFAKTTTGGRQNGRVANIWKALTDRVLKDHPQFPVLSFGKLRKTGATLVRRHGGGEAVSLYLAHGVAYQGDDLLEVYSDRPFPALFSALAVVNDELAPVWEGMPDPFPPALPMGGPNITRGTIRRILELHDSKMKVGQIAEEVGVSRDTVRRWLQRHGKRSKRKGRASSDDSTPPTGETLG